MKTALICGVSGQDGAYLAKLLLEKGYRVIGTSRDATTASFTNLQRLSIREHVECQSMVPSNFDNVIQALSRIRPDEIYNLSGLSSVGLSFEQPIETMESVANASINLMEAVRFLGGGSRLYNASSSECFGDTGDEAACEDTSFHPRSPYAVAKAAAHWATVNYREAYGLFASNGILFNHESPLRPDRFVTRKIITQACRINADRNLKLRLGNLDIVRDWGWAPQYVEAIWRILQIGTADDFVIATGEAHSLQEFVAAAFGELGLDWREHVEHDAALMRPSDIARSKGNPSKAIKVLGWKPSYGMRDVVRMMLHAELHSDAEAGPI
ncbi:GDP-mannose 4,6-dehydratase [Rhodoplanes sp. Z2-YC6860]|uniref:GDP-mannose 4,6-dehydratase n=1 Tax=Rhodoplanes sp. Z2-YC6860 TaxID=674703 RepID=UPI00078BC730|nr:GDP-mannose 4,6-dehydratase [Rhodoplanes sp. Z2-YC6860]AMN41332.1 NAD-dependent epimerase/dehydratase [Rhodoplanes sp. Z2-YC6860]